SDSGEFAALDAVLLGAKPLRHAGAAPRPAFPASVSEPACARRSHGFRGSGGNRPHGAILRPLARVVGRGLSKLRGFSRLPRRAPPLRLLPFPTVRRVLRP